MQRYKWNSTAKVSSHYFLGFEKVRAMAIPIQPQAPIIMNPRNPPGMTTLLALIPVNRITE